MLRCSYENTLWQPYTSATYCDALSALTVTLTAYIMLNVHCLRNNAQQYQSVNLTW